MNNIINLDTAKHEANYVREERHRLERQLEMHKQIIQLAEDQLVKSYTEIRRIREELKGYTTIRSTNTSKAKLYLVR